MELNNPVDVVVDHLHAMRAQSLGALLVFERTDTLDDYIACGPYDAALNFFTLNSIFADNSALKDGAVIIRANKIVAAGIALPLTQNSNYAALSKHHRFALGISEDTDAFAVVLCANTGEINFAEKGALIRFGI